MNILGSDSNFVNSENMTGPYWAYSRALESMEWLGCRVLVEARGRLYCVVGRNIAFGIRQPYNSLGDLAQSYFTCLELSFLFYKVAMTIFCVAEKCAE